MQPPEIALLLRVVSDENSGRCLWYFWYGQSCLAQHCLHLAHSGSSRHQLSRRRSCL